MLAVDSVRYWSEAVKPSPYSNDVVNQFAKQRWPYLANDAFKIAQLPFELSDDIVAGSIHDPVLPEISKLLSQWLDGYHAVMKNTDRFWPILSKVPHGKGCISGNYTPTESRPYRNIYVSIHDPIGAAEGIVHETGHLRLHALGIELEQHDGALIENGSNELFISPIRKDKLRPMSAVLHAQYSYMMVSELDLILIANGIDEAKEYARLNVPRIRNGYIEIDRNAKWTKIGREFFRGLAKWMFSINERYDAIA